MSNEVLNKAKTKKVQMFYSVPKWSSVFQHLHFHANWITNSETLILVKNRQLKF